MFLMFPFCFFFWKVIGFDLFSFVLFLSVTCLLTN